MEHPLSLDYFIQYSTGYNSNVVPPNFVPPSHLKPAIKPTVRLSLTIIYIILYGALFLYVYAQLWMNLFLKHKKFSYRTVMFFICLIWAALRTTLFSFYFESCTKANDLNTLFYWLLYCCPVCLQFTTLCLLTLFFAHEVVLKLRQKSRSTLYRDVLHASLASFVSIFYITSITCAVILKECSVHDCPVQAITIIRVIITGCLFLYCSLALSYFVTKISRLPSAYLVLEAQGLTKCQAITYSMCIVTLFLSRTTYNIIVMTFPIHLNTFGFDWINVSDQADNADLYVGYSYVSFGIVLFMWEFLPTLMVILLFRVKLPEQSYLDELNDLRYFQESILTSKSYFSDANFEHESEDDVFTEHTIPFRTTPRRCAGSMVEQTYLNSGKAKPVYYGSYTHVGSIQTPTDKYSKSDSEKLNFSKQVENKKPTFFI